MKKKGGSNPTFLRLCPRIGAWPPSTDMTPSTGEGIFREFWVVGSELEDALAAT